MLTEILQSFHFLRPLWLLATVPALLLIIGYWRREHLAHNWRHVIDPSLLPYLLDHTSSVRSRWPWALLLLGWLISCIALAGPTWQKLPQPVYQRQDALIIVLDLSRSMLAEDIKPSRLIRARHKLHDLLANRDEGLTGLVVYAGDAHTVSPLTDDTHTLSHLIPALSPDIMPTDGSNSAAAISLAKQLLDHAHSRQGRILWLSDGINPDDIAAIKRTIPATIKLSILGIGTTTGAPIPAQDGFLKKQDGSIAVAQFNSQPMQTLATQIQGRYATITLDNSDLTFLLPQTLAANAAPIVPLIDHQADIWRDDGAWLTLLLLPLACLGFRRGWLLTAPWLIAPWLIGLWLSIITTPPSYADTTPFEWADWWQTADQRGADALANGDFEKAANYFNDSQWKGTAQYRAGNFAEAIESFSDHTPTAYYNRGNALAKAGQWQAAIDAYNQALKLAPDMEDAQFNKALIEQLLSQQEQNAEPSANQDSEPSANQDSKPSANQDSKPSADRDSAPSANQDSAPSANQDSEPSANQHAKLPDNQAPPTDHNHSTKGADANPATHTDDISPPPLSESPPTPQAIDQATNEPISEPNNPHNQQANLGEQKSPMPNENYDETVNDDTLEPLNDDETHEPMLNLESQLTEQWLRQIPDDPAGLLRRKFLYESQKRVHKK